MGGVRAPVTFTSSVLEPYDRGVELGERFQAEIASTVASYRRLFATRAGGTFDLELWADRAWEAIETSSPVYAEEIRGIAEGAARPVQEIAAVNARTELLVAANPSLVATECSSVVSLPPGRAPFAVQTWDWYHAMSDVWFHWRIPHPDGRVVETVTEFGMLAKIGVNEYGVGVMLNMLHHRNDAVRAEEPTVGYPVHLLSRRILDEARTFAEAWEIAQAATSASTSLTVLDRSGAAATIELFPGGPGRLDPVDGVLVRTNHFLSPEGQGGCLAAMVSDSTLIRHKKLVEAFAAAPPSTPHDVLETMTDHEEGVGGICCHPDPAMHPALRTRTLATVVIDVANARLAVSADGPCGHRDP